MHVEPLARRTLHDEVVGRVRDMIIEGTLAPGQRVHEGQLGEAMMVFYEKRQRLDYYKYNQLIHSAIVEKSGNAFLATTHSAAQSRLKRIRFLGNAAPEKWRGAVAEHETMMDALRRRDGEALAAVLARHLDETCDRVKDSL